MTRRLVLLVLGVALALPLVLLAEGLIARQRTYLPQDPGFTVDLTVPGEGPPLELVVLGDSTVAGVGAERPEDSLAGQVAAKLAAGTGRAVHVVGHGVSGARTADVVQEQLPQVEGPVDVVVIEIGSNDVTHLTSLDAVERDTRRMLDRAAELAPVVVLGSAGKLNTPNFLPPLRQVVVWRATQVRQAQREVAEEAQVGFVDIARDVSPAYDATPGSTSEDDFHPSAIGYEIWARPLADEALERLDSSAS